MGGQQKNTRARASHLSKDFYDVAAFRGSLAGEGSLFVVLPLRNTRRGRGSEHGFRGLLAARCRHSADAAMITSSR
jgi:hypothetical protein